MENNETRDDSVVGLDLNQEPSDPVVELGSLLNELETAHGQIEHRIRQLEAVTTRASERHRWRQGGNPSETSNSLIDQMVNGGGTGQELHNQQVNVNVNGGGGGDELHNGQEVEVNVNVNANVNGSQQGVVENGKRFQNGHLLVAKALEMDKELPKVANKGGNFFDCNFCYQMARDPILTCCGHLFCWKCFFKLPFAIVPYTAQIRECPECHGEVSPTDITPIYGNGNGTKNQTIQPEFGMKIPPRPPAQRIESVRQQRVIRRANRGALNIPVAEALRRIRSGVGTIGEHSQRQHLDGVGESSDNIIAANNQIPASGVLPSTEARSNPRFGSNQFSRVLSESAASLSSISLALNDAERLVDDLESYIQDRLLARSNAPSPPVSVPSPLFTSDPVVQPEQQNVYPSIGNNSTAHIASSSRMSPSSAEVPMENLSTDPAAGNNLDVSRRSSSRRRRATWRVSDVENGVVPQPSSSRSRRGASRVSDVESGVSRAPRRRRLR